MNSIKARKIILDNEYRNFIDVVEAQYAATTTEANNRYLQSTHELQDECEHHNIKTYTDLYDDYYKTGVLSHICEDCGKMIASTFNDSYEERAH